MRNTSLYFCLINGNRCGLSWDMICVDKTLILWRKFSNTREKSICWILKSKHCVLSYMLHMASISNIFVREEYESNGMISLGYFITWSKCRKSKQNRELRFMRSFFVTFNEWCATVVDWDHAVEGCRCNCRRHSKIQSDQINSNKYYVLWFRDDSACAFDDSESNQSRNNK